MLAVLLLAPGAALAGEPLWLYAGAGFRNPIEEAASVWQERTGTEIRATFAGSGCLLAQAELAGKGDIFIPGELHYLRQAEDRGATHPRHRRFEVAWLTPTIAVARGNPRGVKGLDDLARPDVRVGMGDPESVAVGMAAESWVAAEATDPAAVRANVKSRSINVNELGSWVSLHAMDAVIVWDATVPLFPQVEAVGEPGLDHATRITGGLLASSKQPDEALAFLDFLVSDEGAAIFRNHGYRVTEGGRVTTSAP